MKNISAQYNGMKVTIFIHKKEAVSVIKRLIKISFVLTFLLLLQLSTLYQTTTYAASDRKNVYDNYGLFDEEDAASLEEQCKEYSDKSRTDIIIVTTDTLKGKSDKTYLEDFYDANGFGYNQEFGDAALLLINMDPSNRSVTIQGYGNAENYLNDDRIEYILDDIIPMLKDGKYYKAMVTFAKETNFYMYNTNYNQYYQDPGSNLFYNTFFQLGVAVLIGAISVLIMAYHSSGRITVNNRTYLDENNSGVTMSRDDYINTTVTRVKKPSNNGGSGGRSSGGGGISAGGHSHSGGSRGF